MTTNSSNVIVVGVDMSETAKRAAEKGADLARATGASLHLVAALKVMGMNTMPTPIIPPQNRRLKTSDFLPKTIESRVLKP